MVDRIEDKAAGTGGVLLSLTQSVSTALTVRVKQAD